MTPHVHVTVAGAEVELCIERGDLHWSVKLVPDTARMLATYLIECADQASRRGLSVYQEESEATP